MASNEASSSSERPHRSAAPSEYIFVDPTSIERHMRKEARRLFLLERADILLQLPDQYKRHFGHLMFWLKEKYAMPVRVMSPYDVPPGPLRARWMGRFLQEREKNNGLRDLPVLAYQYGILVGPNASSATDRSVEQAYVLLDNAVENSDLLPYSGGVERGFDQIPRAIQKKILLKQPLDDTDKLVLNALKEIQEESSNNVGRGSFPPFDEGYDLIHCKTATPDPVRIKAATQITIGSLKTVTSSSSAISSRISKVKVGSRVEVFWPDDEEYYAAKVTQVRNDFYHILYDDGEEEWLPLAEHEFLLSGDEDVDYGRKIPSKPARKVIPVGRPKTADDDDDEELLDDDDDDDLLLDDDDDDDVPVRKVASKLPKIPKKRARARSLSSGAEPSKYMQHMQNRVTLDGCIRPKQTLRRLSDGTYAAPIGRKPMGMYFDNKLGLFVPFAKREASVPATVNSTFNASEVDDRQPIKKRKVFD